MQPLQLHKKGPHLNTLEKFHINVESKANNHLNDDQIITTNAIFDTLARSRLPKPPRPFPSDPSHRSHKALETQPRSNQKASTTATTVRKTGSTHAEIKVPYTEYNAI